MALAGATAAGGIDLRLGADRLAERLMVVGLAVLCSSLAFWLAGRRWTRRHGSALATGFVVIQGGLLLCHPAWEHTGATATAWLMVASMLFFPWGPAAQAAVSGSLAALCVTCSWPHLGAPALPTMDLALGGALSVAGAAVLGRARRTAIAGRTRRLPGRDPAVAGAPPIGSARRPGDVAAVRGITPDLVSTISHELRTPLDVIMGYREILGELLPPGDEATRALTAIERASRELLDLVEGTLDLARLAAGAEHPCMEPVAIRPLFDELAAEYARLPRPASVALIWEPGQAPIIASDRRKLKTVLKNLIANALTFTPAGSVRVECRVTGEGCELRVIDTGIGIRREDQDLVFESARPADGSGSRRVGGTGLYVVRQLVQRLGGRVALESAPGQGSVFTVTLPVSGVHGHRRSAA